MPFRIDTCGNLYSNSVMGVFVESLAPYFKRIILIGFEVESDLEEVNYRIEVDNVEFNSLGPRGKFWDYFQKIHRIKKNIKKIAKTKNDILLLRVPSPLAYVIWKYSGKPLKTILLIIGNPQYTSAYFTGNLFKLIFKKVRSDIHDYRLKKVCKNSNPIIIVNSNSLKRVWGNILGITPYVINTSSISEKDILNHEDVKKKINPPYKLLFVGRVCFDKGIRELLEAMYNLNKNDSISYQLNIIGPTGDLNGMEIDSLISHYKVKKFVTYHGMIKFGTELFNKYRDSHIYVLPSYHEGMPKTIWEAMANGTPVLASRIDGIKDNFVHETDILFVKTKNSKSIVKAVQRLMDSTKLYNRLQKNGLIKSKLYTKENQSRKIVQKINENYKK